MARERYNKSSAQQRSKDLRLVEDYTVMPNCILKHPGIRRELKTTYCLLQSYNWLKNGQREDQVWTSQDKLAHHLGVSKRQLRRDLYELRNLGLIEIFADETTNSNIYEFLPVTQKVLDAIPLEPDGIDEGEDTSVPTRRTPVSPPGGHQCPPKQSKRNANELKLTSRPSDATRAHRSDDLSSDEEEAPPSPPRAAKRKPLPSGSREKEDARPKKHAASSGDHSTWGTKKWVRFFTDQVATTAGEVPVPMWGRDQRMIQDILDEGIDKDRLHEAIVWFGKNYQSIKGLKGVPNLPALKHYWPEIAKAIKKGAKKPQTDEDYEQAWGNTYKGKKG